MFLHEAPGFNRRLTRDVARSFFPRDWICLIELNPIYIRRSYLGTVILYGENRWKMSTEIRSIHCYIYLSSFPHFHSHRNHPSTPRRHSRINKSPSKASRNEGIKQTNVSHKRTSLISRENGTVPRGLIHSGDESSFQCHRGRRRSTPIHYPHPFGFLFELSARRCDHRGRFAFHRVD